MRLIRAYIAIGLIKLAGRTCNTAAGKRHCVHAVTYEWELRR